MLRLSSPVPPSPIVCWVDRNRSAPQPAAGSYSRFSGDWVKIGNWKACRFYTKQMGSQWQIAGLTRVFGYRVGEQAQNYAHVSQNFSPRVKGQTNGPHENIRSLFDKSLRKKSPRLRQTIRLLLILRCEAGSEILDSDCHSDGRAVSLPLALHQGRDVRIREAHEGNPWANLDLIR
jgi:hypothetical protein